MSFAANILDHISTGVIALDEQLRVLAINPAGEALLEVSLSRVLQSPAQQLLPGSAEWHDNLAQALSSNSPLVRRGLPLLLHTGHEIHVDLMITPVADLNEPFALLVEIQPVDRLLKISREGNMVSAQETTRAVIRGLAHEIKNPLGGVRGAAQLLARELPDEGLAEYTHIIIQEADRLRDLVDRMMGPTHKPRLEQLNIHEILEHVRNLVAAESGNIATIKRDYDPSVPDLPGDRTQLIQVVLNIMRNAVQAAGDQSSTITLRTRAQRQFTIGTRLHRLVCRIDIIDDGPGIAAELQPTVFIPMVTGRAEGTGLGLSIAQSIVNQHQGLLEVKSEPGHTCFTIYLPLESQNA